MSGKEASKYGRWILVAILITLVVLNLYVRFCWARGLQPFMDLLKQKLSP
jgi:hypothetical protein